MLSFKKSDNAIAIAMMNPESTEKSKREYIYLKPYNEEGEAEIKTTPEKMASVFKAYLKLDKKLSKSQMDEMLNCYKSNTQPQDKLQRKHEEAVEYTNESLKKYLDFGNKTDLMPVLPDWYTMFVSGQTNSGKSYTMAQFLKYNPTKGKDSVVALLSPVKDDPSLEKIKNLIPIDLDEYKAEFGCEFGVDSLERGSQAWFDDIDTFARKADVKRYQEIRTQFQERARHAGVSTVAISHNPVNGNSTKSSIRESSFWLLFKTNERDCRKLLEDYGAFTKRQVDIMLSQNSRWMLVKKSIPKYAIFEHGVMTF